LDGACFSISSWHILLKIIPQAIYFGTDGAWIDVRYQKAFEEETKGL
jgi:hypothetical protein